MEHIINCCKTISKPTTMKLLDIFEYFQKSCEINIVIVLFVLALVYYAGYTHQLRANIWNIIILSSLTVCILEPEIGKFLRIFFSINCNHEPSVHYFTFTLWKISVRQHFLRQIYLIIYNNIHVTLHVLLLMIFICILLYHSDIYTAYLLQI